MPILPVKNEEKLDEILEERQIWSIEKAVGVS